MPAAGSGSRAARPAADAMYADDLQKPTVEELEEATTTPSASTQLQAGLDHSADGHQFDGHHLVEDESLRPLANNAADPPLVNRRVSGRLSTRCARRCTQQLLGASWQRP